MEYRTTDHAYSPHVVRLELNRESSALHSALCGADDSNGGRCRFRSEVRLPGTVDCDGKECSVDTVVVVKLGGAGIRTNGDRFDVYYEYVRQPCVSLSYFDDPVLITPRVFRTNAGVKPMCANPRLPMAGTSCCASTPTGVLATGKCVHEYSDELVTLATAEARCAAYGSDFVTCAKEGSRCQCATGAEARYGYEEVHTSSSWSAPVTVKANDFITCAGTSFGNHVVPGGRTAICQCRDKRSYSLCDLAGPNSKVDAHSGSGCAVGSRHFWSAGSHPCQMQAKVGFNGLITMVDFVKGPTATLSGAATMSSGTAKGAEYGNDGLDYTMTRPASAGEPNPWWQLDLGAPRAVGSFTVHNWPGRCATRLFDTKSAGCRWEHPADADAVFPGFKVGVSNTSCSNNGEGCGGVICKHVVRPTAVGEGHEYHVRCNPPVVGTHAYIVLPGEERLLYVMEVGVRGPDAAHRGRYPGVEFKSNAPVTFGVRWQDGSFPRADRGNCSGVCAVHTGATCLCNVTAVTEAVFRGSTLDDDAVPSVEEIKAELRIGAVDPSHFDHGTFVRCASASCVGQPNVTVYTPGGGSSHRLTADTVFAIPDQAVEGQLVFFKNARSTVRLDGGGFAFRNPPSFSTRNQLQDGRDGEHDIDAVLSHYFDHPTTPPFVAKTMIQRLVTSNPSPRYVEVVAVAFKTGRHLGFGDGVRGDMAAITAAIYLDREAQSYVLENDPVHGGLREPLIKLIHMLRALELELMPTAPLLSLQDTRIVQFPFESPTVFSFFQHDYAPGGAVEQASLVAPEASIYTAPNIMLHLNGTFATVEMGISTCYGGFGTGLGGYMPDDHVTSCSSAADLVSPATFGRLAHTPGGRGWRLLNIPESARSYSSTYDKAVPGRAWARSRLGSPSAWRPARGRGGQLHEWMEMDLGKSREVAGVATQGHEGFAPAAVLRFKVKYSTDRVSYESLPDSFWVGGPGNDWGTNTSHVGGALVRHSVGDRNSAADLQACQGDCYNDDDCAPGLKCFQRSRGPWLLRCHIAPGLGLLLRPHRLGACRPGREPVPAAGDREVHSAGAAGVVQGDSNARGRCDPAGCGPGGCNLRQLCRRPRECDRSGGRAGRDPHWGASRQSQPQYNRGGVQRDTLGHGHSLGGAAEGAEAGANISRVSAHRQRPRVPRTRAAGAAGTAGG